MANDVNSILYLMIQPITWPVSKKNLIELEEI